MSELRAEITQTGWLERTVDLYERIPAGENGNTFEWDRNVAERRIYLGDAWARWKGRRMIRRHMLHAERKRRAPVTVTWHPGHADGCDMCTGPNPTVDRHKAFP